MAYTHLALEERYHISALSVQGLGPAAIAAEIGRDKSTVSRELRRNRGQRGYRAKQADQMAHGRWQQAYNGPQVPPQTWAVAKEGILEGWSPQQVAERLRREQSLRISHETIYQRIYADKAAGGQLYKKLRCQKKRRKRYGSGRNRRGHIPARVGIEKRPYLVQFRLRAGDWEGDTIIGANQQQAIVSLVDRKTRYTLLKKVERKTAALVADAIVEELKRIDDPIPHAHSGQWFRICSTPACDANPWRRGIFCSPLLLLGARPQREHQRIGPTVHFQEKAL